MFVLALTFSQIVLSHTHVHTHKHFLPYIMRELVADMTDPSHFTHKYCSVYVLKKKKSKHSQKIKIRKSTEVQHNCLVYKPYSIHQLSSYFYRKGESFCFCFFPQTRIQSKVRIVFLGPLPIWDSPSICVFIPWMFLRRSGQFFGSIAFIWVCLGSPPLCIFGSVQVCCGVGEDS